MPSRLPRFIRTWAALFGCAFVLPSGQAQELTVSAAASLGDAFKEIGKAFEAARPGTKIVFNFGASGPLVQQIAQGAPVDVLACADAQTMDQAAARGLVARDSQVTVAYNTLVLVVPASAAAVPPTLGALATPAFRRVAIGQPASVPAGRYAREALDEAGVAAGLENKLIYGDTVRQVLAYVARAEVDAGFVYRTDALTERERVRIALNLSTRTPVTYPIAVVSSARQARLARDFIAYAGSAPAQAIFARYGFAKP